jgi:hypothetical protein
MADWRWFIFATSVLSLLPFLWSVKQSATCMSFAFLTFTLPWNLLFLIQTPFRQSMAVTLFLIGGYLFVCKGKNKIALKFFGIVFMIWGIFTHTTMYLVAPAAILLYFVRLNKTISISLIVGSFILCLFVSSIFSQLLDLLMTYTSDNNDVFGNINRYYGDDNYEISEKVSLNAILPLTVSSFAITLLSNKEQFKNYAFKCMVVGVVVMNISVTFPLASRVGLLFSLLGASFVPNRLFRDKREHKYDVYLLYLIIFVYFLVAYRHWNMCFYFKKSIATDILPYTFWFENILDYV